ncbi:cytochrome o ubiquinol oxidase subunit IV [Alicyclobacillus fodiniaquatilis]|uniref:Cytochrome o ubiquinol/quinol oxidase subunit IV n=1 Tax=Alicyclobacillus fodiniaquatilis TaxID=1661150 RepID=A0ABW4JNT2_9BACL
MSINKIDKTRSQHSPKLYIIGYLASLILSAISFLLALNTGMHVGLLVVILTVLAGLQIVVQLFFFMHITESDGPPYHAVLLVLGLIFTFAIALMSVWIMAFGTNVSY